MIRNAIGVTLFCAIGLAVWKIWGGDMGSFFTAIWGFFYAVVDAVSTALVTAWNAMPWNS